MSSSAAGMSQQSREMLCASTRNVSNLPPQCRCVCVRVIHAYAILHEHPCIVYHSYPHARWHPVYARVITHPRNMHVQAHLPTSLSPSSLQSHTYIRIHIHTYMHTCAHTYICFHACVHAYTNTYVHAYMHAYIICNTAPEARPRAGGKTCDTREESSPVPVVGCCCSFYAPGAASNAKRGKSFIQKSPTFLGARTVIRFQRVHFIRSCDLPPGLRSALNGETKSGKLFIHKPCRTRTGSHVKGRAEYDICQGGCLFINPETSRDSTAGKLDRRGNCSWIMVALITSALSLSLSPLDCANVFGHTIEDILRDVRMTWLTFSVMIPDSHHTEQCH